MGSGVEATQQLVEQLGGGRHGPTQVRRVLPDARELRIDVGEATVHLAAVPTKGLQRRKVVGHESPSQLVGNLVDPSMEVGGVVHAVTR